MSLFTVGCSFTEGTGVKRQNNYTNELANMVYHRPMEYAAAGHSNQYIFRKTIELLKDWNKNDILIIQWTHPNRQEIITKEGFIFQPPACDWMSLEFLYGPNPGPALEKVGILNKDEFDAKVVKRYKDKVINYASDFYYRDYQLHLSFCFQFALWGLLEKLDVKYLMFFGWEFERDYENQKQIFNFTNEKFLKETFGSFTNTTMGQHPDTEGHLQWANHLYEKLIEFNYITDTKNNIQ